MGNNNKKNELSILDNKIFRTTESVQNSIFSLTALEGRALDYMISKIKPTDDPSQVYIFDCKEFMQAIGYKSTKNYVVVRNLVNRLDDIKWWLRDDNGDLVRLRFFNKLRESENKSNTQYKFSFHEEVAPYFFKLAEQVANGTQTYIDSYSFKYVARMKGLHTRAFYILLHTYLNIGTWTFEYGTGSDKDILLKLKTEFNEKTGKFETNLPETYSKWAQFRRKILETSIAEINEKSDIMVDYEPLKKDLYGNPKSKISTIKFSIRRKSETELNKLYKDIDSAYGINSINSDDLEQLKNLSVEQDLREEFFFMLDDKLKNMTEKDKAHAVSECFGEIYSLYNIGFDKIGTLCELVYYNYEYLLKASQSLKEEGFNEKGENAIEKLKERTLMIMYNDYCGFEACAVEPISGRIFCQGLDDYISLKEMDGLEDAIFSNGRSPVCEGNKIIDRGLIVSDMLEYYGRKIKFSAMRTSTTPYNRLRDCLLKDYDEYFEKIKAKYINDPVACQKITAPQN